MDTTPFANCMTSPAFMSPRRRSGEARGITRPEVGRRKFPFHYPPRCKKMTTLSQGGCLLRLLRLLQGLPFNDEWTEGDEASTPLPITA